jgi:hypothetical protein
MNKYLNNTLTGKESPGNGRAFWATKALFLNGCSRLLPGQILTGRRMSVTCPWPIFKVFSNTKHWGCNANNILNPEVNRKIMELKISKVWHSLKWLGKWSSLKCVSMNAEHWLDVCGSMHHSTIRNKSNKMQQCINFLLYLIYMKLNMFWATHHPSSGA